MQYTTSDANVVHAGTGHRMHQGTEPVPTQVSADDMNQVTWSLMEVLNEAGVDGAEFDPDDPSSYRALVTALNAIYTRRPDLDKRGSSAKRFWSILRGLEQDASWLSLSDSTGNTDIRWVRLVANQLAAACPTHTVLWYTWNDGTTAWNAPVTIQTGTTARTLRVYNCAVGGSNTFYAEGLREAAIWGDTDFDLVSLNYGDNYGTALVEKTVFPEYMLALANARAHAPNASLVINLQPAMTSGPGANYSKRIVPAQLKSAQLFNCGVADAYSAFKNHPNPPSLYDDNTHPSPLGSQLWAGVFMGCIAEPADLGGDMPMCFNPLHSLRPVNYATNGNFGDWAGATPAGWNFNNCTPTKDIGNVESGVYSCKVTATGANPTMTQDLSTWIPALRGRTALLQVRIKRQTGMTELAGRVGLASTDGTTSAFDTSFNRGPGNAGDWECALIYLKIPKAHTSLTLTIYIGDAAGADTGKSVNVDWALVTPGVVPGWVSPDPRKFVTDVFADANALILPGTTGTFTCVGGVMTISGASPLAEGVVNVIGATPGEKYRVTANPTASTGGTTGNILVRNGYNGGSTTLDTIPWTVGTPVSFVYTHPAGPVSLRPHGSTGTTGFVMSGWTIKPVMSLRDGPRQLDLLSLRNADATAMAAAPAAGKFGLSHTLGTGTYLVAEAAQNNTKTSEVYGEYILPADYIPGRDVSFTINAQVTGTGTLGPTKTLTLVAYEIDKLGAYSANLGPAAATLVTAATDYVLPVTGTNLKPGDRLAWKATMVVQESANVSTLTGRLNSITAS